MVDILIEGLFPAVVEDGDLLVDLFFGRFVHFLQDLHLGVLDAVQQLKSSCLFKEIP